MLSLEDKKYTNPCMHLATYDGAKHKRREKPKPATLTVKLKWNTRKAWYGCWGLLGRLFKKRKSSFLTGIWLVVGRSTTPMSRIEGPGHYCLRLDSIWQLIRPSIEDRRVFRETWMPQYSVATYSFDKHPLIIFHPLHCFATAIIFHLAWYIHLIHDSRIREKQNIAHFLITILGPGWQGQLLTFARYAYYLFSLHLVESISGQFSWLGSQSYLRTVEMERNLKSLVVS